jgi:hypothetical protein
MRSNLTIKVKKEFFHSFQLASDCSTDILIHRTIGSILQFLVTKYLLFDFDFEHIEVQQFDFGNVYKNQIYNITEDDNRRGTADFFPNGRVKIKSIEKNQLLQNVTVFKLKVVKVGSRNIPSIDHVNWIQAKYLFYNRKFNLKLSKSFTQNEKYCQICCEEIFPKHKHQILNSLCESVNKRCGFFPQTNKNPYSCAEMYSFINCFLSQIFNFPDKIKRTSVKQFSFSKLLLSGDIHPNPGPRQGETKLEIKSYNSRGLKNRLKLKRI